MRPKVNRGRVYVVGVVAIVTVEWRCWSGATFSDSGIELYFGGILTAKERMPDIAAQPEVSNAHDEGVCGAGSLGAGETCELRCAEGFEARGKAMCCCCCSRLQLLAEGSCVCNR